VQADKYKKALWKEFTRSPAKTATLLIMLPVALYFCAPLFKGFLPTKSKQHPAKVLPKQDPFLAITQAAEATPVETETVSRWQDVANWMKRDVLASATNVSPAMRNPFAGSATSDSDDENDEQGDENVEAAHDAADQFGKLDLQLTATMVGSTVKLATINGEVFREGQVIPVVIEQSGRRRPIQIEATLSQIERRAVVLECDGTVRRLQLRNEIPRGAIVKPIAN
jgi:hypothetical protein